MHTGSKLGPAVQPFMVQFWDPTQHILKACQTEVKGAVLQVWFWPISPYLHPPKGKPCLALWNTGRGLLTCSFLDGIFGECIGYRLPPCSLGGWRLNTQAEPPSHFLARWNLAASSSTQKLTCDSPILGQPFWERHYI